MLRFSRLRTVAMLNWGISLTIFGLTIPIGLCTQYLPLFYGSIVAGTLFVSIVVVVAAYAIQLKVALRHIRSIRSTLPKLSLDTTYTASPLSTKFNEEPTFESFSSRLPRNPQFSDVRSYENSCAVKGDLLRTSSPLRLGSLNEDRGAEEMMSNIHNSQCEGFVDETIPEAENYPEAENEKYIIQHRRRKISKPQEDLAESQGSNIIELGVFCIEKGRGWGDVVKDEMIDVEKITVCTIESHRCPNSLEYKADIYSTAIIDEGLCGDDVGEVHRIPNLKGEILVCDDQISSCWNIADAEVMDSKLESLGALSGNEELDGKKIEQCVTPTVDLREFREGKGLGEELYECITQKCCRNDFEEASVPTERQKSVLTLKLSKGAIVTSDCLRYEPGRLTTSKKAESHRMSVPRKLIASKQELRALIYCIGISLGFILTWFLTGLGALGLLINNQVLTSPHLSDVADIIVAFGASFNSMIFVITNKKMRRSLGRRFRKSLQCFR